MSGELRLVTVADTGGVGSFRDDPSRLQMLN
jgi:hypothetical protein